MTEKHVPLTRDGKARLEDELETLRSQRRAASARLHDAREQGTSQHDAEYDDATIELSMVEGRILEVEDLLRRATLMDGRTARNSGRVILGSTVEVEQNGKTRQYQIVAVPEADAAHGRISNESPVGASLLGKRAGDIVDVHVPKGAMKLKILKIE